MTTTYLKTQLDKHTAVVTIDRPEKKNALSPELLAEIEITFQDLSKNSEVNVIVLTGGEEMFSAGFDLDIVRSIKRENNDEFISLFHNAYRAILFCSQPVIAAVGGPAIAGGFDLTMMCDIRYASEKARFGQREIALSLTPIMDPLWRIIGMGRAREVALTGRVYDAAEAEKMGYVSGVFPAGQLLERVLPIATDMAAYDGRCLRETKALANMIVDEDLDGAMRTQEWLFRSHIGSSDNQERVDRLLAELKKPRPK
ncbi:MAG: enoyl-CoA hydratase/isomerase family protein [Desulfosudaceae bacterium]